MMFRCAISVPSSNCFVGTGQSLIPAKTVTLSDEYFNLNRILCKILITISGFFL